MSQEVSFQGRKVRLIECDGSRAWIASDCGGRLLRWVVDDIEVIFWPESADWSKPAKIRGGNPLLFPFIARHILDGQIGFWMDGDTKREMPMHGFARDLPFEVTTHHKQEIHLRLSDNEKTREWFPYSFHFDVRMTVLSDALEVALKTTNCGHRPLPYYAGHHFYFAIPAAERKDWQLNIPCCQTARQDPDGNIHFWSSTTIDTHLDDPELIDRFHILESPRPVVMENQKNGRRIKLLLDFPETAPWGAVTTWSESTDSDFFCVEPWQGLPNAIHHLHGLRTLAPGKSEESICRIVALNA